MRLRQAARANLFAMRATRCLARHRALLVFLRPQRALQIRATRRQRQPMVELATVTTRWRRSPRASRLVTRATRCRARHLALLGRWVRPHATQILAMHRRCLYTQVLETAAITWRPELTVFQNVILVTVQLVLLLALLASSAQRNAALLTAHATFQLLRKTAP